MKPLIWCIVMIIGTTMGAYAINDPLEDKHEQKVLKVAYEIIHTIYPGMNICVNDTLYIRNNNISEELDLLKKRKISSLMDMSEDVRQLRLYYSVVYSPFIAEVVECMQDKSSDYKYLLQFSYQDKNLLVGDITPIKTMPHKESDFEIIRFIFKYDQIQYNDLPALIISKFKQKIFK